MAIKFTQVTDHTNQRIINVASPTLDTDAANKVYVDNVAQGLNWKQAARVASTGNVTLATPGATIDGVTLANGDRVLLKNQTTGSENGIYVFNGASSALTRALDANTSAKVTAGAALSVAEGSVNGDKTYVLVTDGPITLDTTALTFSLMNGGSGTTYTAGNGISVSGGVVSVNTGVGGGLIAAAGGLSVDTSLIVRKYAANVGDGTSTTITVNHNLGTRDVDVTLYLNGGTYETVYAEVQRPDVNNVALVFGSAPASAAYRVVVHA
jgi:hypothetical protein